MLTVPIASPLDGRARGAGRLWAGDESGEGAPLESCRPPGAPPRLVVLEAIAVYVAALAEGA